MNTISPGENQSEPVRILCAANSAYAAPLCVMLTSLAIHLNKRRKLEIYILGTNIHDEDRRKIETSLRRNRPDLASDCIRWLSPNLDSLQGMFVHDWAGIEVFARLLAPCVLPQGMEKILYLDSDMVVVADISPLYDMPLRGSVHAVLDEAVGFVSEPRGVFNYAELGIPANNPYFNSGVMLMNLPYWRKNNVAERVMDYLRAHQDLVFNWDQGGLNAVLYDSWVEVDPAWNQIHYIVFPHRWKDLGRSMDLWRKTRDHPKIIHFTSREKPWITCERPRYSYFFKYLAKTEYRGSYKGACWEQIVGFRFAYLWDHAKVVLFWKRTPKDLLRVLKRFVSSHAEGR